jgi:hypothetical protein
VAFDPIMVFPQGNFSSAAMAALRAGGYLAAINTTCFPRDEAEAEPLTIGDLLRPAIAKFHGFPLFPRRYPGSFMDAAFDMFVGRPVLLVQHAGDFRDGYRQLEAFVDGLRKLEPTLTWGGLADQLMQTCMASVVDEHSMRVRFFTHQFRFRNPRSTRIDLSFSKEEPEPHRIADVLVGGRSVPFAMANGLLTFAHQVDAGQLLEVRVVDMPRSPARATGRGGVAHTVGVSLRRGLSELRDNTLAKHPRLLAAATGLARRMKVTGEDDAKARG